MRRPAVVYAALFVVSFLLVVLVRRLPERPAMQPVAALQQTGSVFNRLTSAPTSGPATGSLAPAVGVTGASAPRVQAPPPPKAKVDVTAGLSKIAVPDPKLSYDDSLRRRFRAEKLLQDANAATVPVDRVNALATLRDFAATQGDPGGEIVSLMRALIADDDPDVARTAKQITWQLTGGN